MWKHRGAQCLSILLWAQILRVTHGKKKDNKTQVSFEMPRHSFYDELDFDDGLEYWLTSAGTMALADRVQLMPPVADRYGLFWSRPSVNSDNFEITFNFTGKGTGDAKSVFAVWIGSKDFAESYVEQRIVEAPTKKWIDGLTNNGYTFLHNKPDFEGLAIFFFAQPQGPSQSNVLALWCDGTSMSMDRIWSVGGTKESFQWMNRLVTGKVRFAGAKSTQIAITLAEAEGGGAGKWFTVDQKKPVKPFWFGFSGYSGEAAACDVDIEGVSTRNYDLSTPGEEVNDLFEEDTDEWLSVMEATKVFVSNANQKDAIETLNRLLGDYIARYNAHGESIKSELIDLETRLTMLDQSINQFMLATEAFDFEKHSMDAKFVQGHIMGIGHLFDNEVGQHHSKIDEVRRVAGEIKDSGGTGFGEAGKAKMQTVALQAKALEDHSARGSTQTNGLLLMMLVVVTCLGCLFLNRMRYYEKKHYI